MWIKWLLNSVKAGMKSGGGVVKEMVFFVLVMSRRSVWQAIKEMVVIGKLKRWKGRWRYKSELAGDRREKENCGRHVSFIVLVQ